MSKVWKYTKLKGKYNIGAVIGEDGDLFIGYEGGIPIRARGMLDLYYKYSKQAGDLYYLDKQEIKRTRKIQERFKELEFKLAQKPNSKESNAK